MALIATVTGAALTVLGAITYVVSDSQLHPYAQARIAAHGTSLGGNSTRPPAIRVPMARWRSC